MNVDGKGGRIMALRGGGVLKEISSHFRAGENRQRKQISPFNLISSEGGNFE